MKHAKLVILASTFAFALSLTTGVLAAELKIGYVDMQEAIQSTKAGKKAKTELETEFQKKKKELDKKQADLEKMSKDLERKKNVLTEDVMDQKQKELQEEMMKYRELMGKSQMEIQKRERELTEPIFKKLKAAIEKVAKDDGYSFILEKAEQSVVWANPDLNLTKKIVEISEKL
jgi:outer membrane protein